jgi:hypothetical protein
MSGEGEGSGSVPPPPPLPQPSRLAVHLPTPALFTGEGEDLKPEAFDRWYAAVRLYLNLSGVRPNDEGSGNYWILYTTGRALEAAHQSLRRRGDDITRDQLVSDLRKLFQTSRQQDNLYERFNNVQQVQHGKVRRITEVIVDLRMYQGRLGEGTISNYAFTQKLFSCMHTN